VLPQVNEAFLRVISMLDGTAALFHPSVVLRVLHNRVLDSMPEAVNAAVRTAVKQYTSWVPGKEGMAGAVNVHHSESLLSLLGVAGVMK
jgi:hypothetical protein